MRIVSWMVVATSIVALLYPYLSRVVSSVALPAVAMEQVAGTALSPNAIRTPESLQEFARDYTRAWNSREPERVAEFFAEKGSLTVNDGDPQVGSDAIAGLAAGFMNTFPDLEVTLRDLEARNGKLIYHWSLSGTHRETGQRVSLQGTETWVLDEDGLIARSIGRYDEREYARQVARSD